MEKRRNTFLDGLVIGAAIGGAAVFLLGTKKGREILKILQEEGKDRFSKLEGMLSEYQDVLRHPGEYIEEIEEATKELPSTVAKAIVDKEKVEEVKHTTKASTEKAKAGLGKKLFRGISKRKSA